MTKARTAQSPSQDELAESARAIVHDTGDPRIDAHLRALGLADDPVEPVVATPAVATPATEPTMSPEVEVLRGRLAELEVQLAASSQRVRVLVAALAVALVAAATFAVLFFGQAS
jgi:hypothetical protein